MLQYISFKHSPIILLIPEESIKLLNIGKCPKSSIYAAEQFLSGIISHANADVSTYAKAVVPYKCSQVRTYAKTDDNTISA